MNDVSIQGALAGLRVVDFSRHMAAPYATVSLADFGADVLKVESVPHGDGSRGIGPRVNGTDESALYMMWNRGKRSIALDLSSSEGKQVAFDLIASADVLVESYRPGVADAIGIGYESMAELNPRLIYCSLTAFGPTGPLSSSPGTDPVVQALTGVMHLTGEPDGSPMLVGVPIADFSGAMVLSQGILLALLARERTGCGQRVEVSMLRAVLHALTTRLAGYWATGDDPDRVGSRHSMVVPYEAFEASDGWVIAGAWGETAWPRFCRAIGLPELERDDRFRQNEERRANRDALRAILAPVFAADTRAHWQRKFEEERALFGQVLSIAEILEHPQVVAANLVEEVNHTIAGQIRQLRSPVQLSGTPGVVDVPPPAYGEHSAAILSEIGYRQGRIEGLLSNGTVIQQPIVGNTGGGA